MPPVQKRRRDEFHGAAASIRYFLSELSHRVEEAASIAKAADACSGAGNPAKAVEIALVVEQMIYDAGTVLHAARLRNRIATG
jgi:hypothetical protein